MAVKTTRPVAMATGGMVASPHYFASLAGLRVLQEGGSAVDAAIAVNSTLGVVYPHMTGMGGDSFWLIHEIGRASCREGAEIWAGAGSVMGAPSVGGSG